MRDEDHFVRGWIVVYPIIIFRDGVTVEMPSHEFDGQERIESVQIEEGGNFGEAKVEVRFLGGCGQGLEVGVVGWGPWGASLCQRLSKGPPHPGPLPRGEGEDC